MCERISFRYFITLGCIDDNMLSRDMMQLNTMVIPCSMSFLCLSLSASGCLRILEYVAKEQIPVLKMWKLLSLELLSTGWFYLLFFWSLSWWPVAYLWLWSAMYDVRDNCGNKSNSSLYTIVKAACIWQEDKYKNQSKYLLIIYLDNANCK